MFDLWYRDLEIYEGNSAFYIMLHKDDGDKREVCMGDGVDQYSNFKGETLPVGTPRFYIAMASDLIANYDHYIATYFPEEQ